MFLLNMVIWVLNKAKLSLRKCIKAKKSGETEDGKVVKEYTITVPLNEETIDVDYIGGREASKKV